MDRQEALAKLLKAEPYVWGSDRELIKRKLQLRFIAKHMPESHQKFWRLRVHRWFIDQKIKESDSPRIAAIFNDAISRMHEGSRCKTDGKFKPLSTRKVNKLIKRIYKELSKFYDEHESKCRNRWILTEQKQKPTRIETAVYIIHRQKYWMDKHLGMYLNMATLEETWIHELLDTTSDDEDFIETHKINWKYTRENREKKIARYTGLHPDITGVIATYVI